jgi:cellulose synthase/poly-beta-1,6-N-acetylglucosamine synthase-like glycosyltransferase
MNEPSVSIITICESWSKFIEESLSYYIHLDYENYQIYVFSTEPILPDFAKRKLISYITTDEFKANSLKSYGESIETDILIEKLNNLLTKINFINNLTLSNNAPLKRDMAIKYAMGEYFAFIDDDAYPSKDWLKSAIVNFDDEKVTAVGGPGITPINASLLEHASGYISASPAGGFGNTYRFIPGTKRFVDDYPSVNLIIKADDFKAINGFDSNYYPGEDTKLCLDLTYKLNKKIIYDPEVFVYHHKRPLFKHHLTQNSRFGIHRGYFAKILPETSRRWFYFVPAIFSFGLIFGDILAIASLFTKNPFIHALLYIYMIPLTLYFLILLINGIWVFIKSKSISITLLSILGTYATHFYYGINFIKGLFKTSLEDNYGRIEN